VKKFEALEKNSFKVKMSIPNTQTLDLQPYEWASSDRDNTFSIRIWTHNKDSERVLLRVEDYQPFCRIELPTVVGGRVVKWNQEALKVYANWIRTALNEHAPTSIIYKEMQKLYWYKPGVKYPFFVCYFQTEEAMRHCVKLINKKGYAINQLGFIKSRVWETSITSIHRLVTDGDLGYGQWLRAEAQVVPELDKISSCKHEYIVSHKDLRKLSPEETKGWNTSPLVAAIDIECYSHRHRAMPNMNYAEDVVFQLSYITQRLGDPSTRKKYLLALGNCGDIEGAEVIRFDHELSLIDGLCDLINQTDPTILTGYNIFKFDFPYMDARMKLYFRDWRKCGLIKDQETSVNVRKWKSSAYGFMTLATLEAEGRLCIDMFTLIKRDHKLDRYTLDFVSKHFLGKGKHDVTARQMFEIYQEAQNAAKSGDPDRIHKSREELAKVGAYCLEDSCLCIDLMEALSTWIMLIELSTIVEVTVMEIFTRGQQIRVQNQVYTFVYNEDFVIDERPGSKEGFKGGQVFDPVPGKYHNILIFDFASLYPSIIRAFNICYSTLVPDESDIPDSMCHVLQWTETDDKGAQKFYRYRFIKQEYFHGFLPRMCEHLVKARKATRNQIGPQNNDVTNIVLNQRQLGLKISANSIFGSLGVKEGRLPLPEGARCITAMGRQLTLMAADHVEKTNQGMVVYGDTDSIMVDSQITDPHECIAKGEALSKELSALYPDPLFLEFERALSVALFIKKKKYAGVPLSIIKMKPEDIVEEVAFTEGNENPELKLWKVTQIRENERHPGQMDTRIQYVGIPRDIAVTGREIIAGMPLAEGGAPNDKQLLKKGIVLARRDNCLWVREGYKKILLNILFDKPLQDTLNLVDEEIKTMMTRQVPFHKMMVTREIGSNYKPNSTYPLKLFADELRRQGHPIQSGERIDYIFVRCQEQWRNEKQGYKMRLPEMYWSNCYTEPIDTLHYVEKGLKNPVEQIVYLGYKDEIDKIEQRCDPPVKRRGKIYTYVKHDYINTWVKLIKYKENLINSIKTYKPHFPSQEQYFIESYSDQPMILEVK